jgi:hypothetical protein
LDPEAERQLPLEDVQLCQTDTTNCALSKGDGQVRIELPIGEETSYTLKKDGYASYLVPVVIPSDEGYQDVFSMATDEEMKAQFSRLGSFYPMLLGTGAVVLWVFPAFAGATFDLANATGKAYYVHERGDWRDDITATTSRGAGGFVEVPPGEEFQVNLGGTAAGCKDSIRFPVREGYITAASVTCPLPSTLQLRVVVNEAVEGLGAIYSGPRLEGVEVCETDTINCATTDADGEARLLVPKNEEISYTMTKDGYVPYLNGIKPQDTQGGGFRSFMVSNAQMADLAEDLMIPYPLTGGIVVLRAGAPRMAGVTFALVDETAVGYYIDEAGAVTLDLTATTSGGDGGFLEVTPREHQIEFGGTATNCRLGRGWQGDATNRIRLLVRVGHITYGQMFSCNEP